MYLSLQHSNIPMKNGIVFVFCNLLYGCKTMNTQKYMYYVFVSFVIHVYMYAVQKLET